MEGLLFIILILVLVGANVLFGDGLGSKKSRGAFKAYTHDKDDTVDLIVLGILK